MKGLSAIDRKATCSLDWTIMKDGSPSNFTFTLSQRKCILNLYEMLLTIETLLLINFKASVTNIDFVLSGHEALKAPTENRQLGCLQPLGPALINGMKRYLIPKYTLHIYLMSSINKAQSKGGFYITLRMKHTLSLSQRNRKYFGSVL